MQFQEGWTVGIHSELTSLIATYYIPTKSLFVLWTLCVGSGLSCCSVYETSVEKLSLRGQKGGKLLLYTVLLLFVMFLMCQLTFV